MQSFYLSDFKIFLKLIYTTLFLSVFSTTTLSADFSKGRVAYENGDFQSALQEWLPLAEGGDSKAQYALGWMYEKKLLQSVAAIKWYTLAANGNDRGAKLRDDFESMMTSRQIKKALSLARECISKNYQGC